ncbi:MAG TPA: beta-ketoacyl synthase N-terminal-like domain-containing protein [Polyangiaceae bacterium]|nr:beta-ketoacyl synthase N-terminal-like domain-containing protein [Polyangiaceae bacterium]
MSRPCFITGMGAISSLGNDVDTLFACLLDGKSGVRAYPEWSQHRGLRCHLGAPVSDYDVSALPRTVRRSMSRMSEMATLATLQALAQAGLQPGADLNRPRTLLALGSTTGSPATLETYFKKLFERGGPEGQLSTSFFKVMNHSVAANVAAGLAFNGAVISPSSACSTSSQAMILGWELISAGVYDRVIAGGADELHYTSAAIFDIVHAASTGFNNRPNESPRPFDAQRDGLVVSEGAGVVVLESEESMSARGVRPLARLVSGDYSCDGTHMSQSNAAAMAQVMRAALRRGGVAPSDVGYVNAHATGTLQGDSEEAAAIAEVFGADIPVSSIKGHLGHSLAACGALEAIVSIRMMAEGVLIPTRNLKTVDPSLAKVQFFSVARKTETQMVLSNNFAFGGMSTSLLLARPNVA